jgi:hypothetical protein
MAKLLTRAEFARKIGRSRGRITQLVKAGVIRVEDGKIDFEEGKARLAASVDSRSEGSPKPRKQRFSVPIESNGLQSLTDVRRDHELLKKQLTGLQLEIAKGNLVPRDQAIQWVIDQIMVAKSGFLSLPYRLREPLAVVSDPKEIFQILRKEVRELLTRMANSLNPEKKKEVLNEIESEGPTVEKTREGDSKGMAAAEKEEFKK